MNPKDKKQAVKVFKLIDQRVRCIILSRYGAIGVDAWGDYFNKALEFEDDILEEIYGTRDWLALGIQLGLVKPIEDKRTEPKRVKLKKKKKRVKLKKKRK